MDLTRARQFVRATVFVLAVGISAGCADGAGSPGSSVLELKLGHASPPGSPVAVAVGEFARRVDEELGGRVSIREFGSSQLGSDEVLLIKLRLGTVDIAVPSTVMSSTIDAFGFFEIPYLVKDREHLERIEREIFWPHLAPLAEEKGFQIVALWEHGFRQITNNRRPITTPEDLRGIKLRTPSGYWRIGAFQAFGANPTPMPLSEVFVALQMGVLDGQENPLQQIYASRFQEVQRYLSVTNHVYSPLYVTVGEERWATLPPEIREALERIARETQVFSRATAARMDEELRAELEASGMEVNEIDREGFVEASRPIYERFGNAVPGGSSWIEMALALEDDPADDARPE